MPSHLIPIQSNKKQFKLIYDLVIQQDEGALRELQNKGVDINRHFPGLGMVVQRLAVKGKVDAVRWMIQHFNANEKVAIVGLVGAGYLSKVYSLFENPNQHLISILHGLVLRGEICKAEDLLKQGISTSIAAQICAEKGLDKEVEHLRYIDINTYYGALVGYATAGNKEEVDNILARYSAYLEKKRRAGIDISEFEHLCIESALEAYLSHGFISEIEDLVGCGVKLDKAISLLKENGYFEDKNAILAILATINNDTLREKMAEATGPACHSSILKQAKTLNEIMHSSNLDFEDSKKEMNKMDVHRLFATSKATTSKATTSKATGIEQNINPSNIPSFRI